MDEMNDMYVFLTSSILLFDFLVLFFGWYYTQKNKKQNKEENKYILIENCFKKIKTEN